MIQSPNLINKTDSPLNYSSKNVASGQMVNSNSGGSLGVGAATGASATTGNIQSLAGPTSSNLNVLLAKPTLPGQTSQLLSSSSSTLSQALAKPPPLPSVLKSSATNSLTPSPSIVNQQILQQPPSFLTMPKNVLASSSSNNSLTNGTNTNSPQLQQAPLIGSNLIAQSKKAAAGASNQNNQSETATNNNNNSNNNLTVSNPSNNNNNNNQLNNEQLSPNVNFSNRSSTNSSINDLNLTDSSNQTSTNNLFNSSSSSYFTNSNNNNNINNNRFLQQQQLQTNFSNSLPASASVQVLSQTAKPIDNQFFKPASVPVINNQQQNLLNQAQFYQQQHQQQINTPPPSLSQSLNQSTSQQLFSPNEKQSAASNNNNNNNFNSLASASNWFEPTKIQSQTLPSLPQSHVQPQQVQSQTLPPLNQPQSKPLPPFQPLVNQPPVQQQQQQQPSSIPPTFQPQQQPLPLPQQQQQQQQNQLPPLNKFYPPNQQQQQQQQNQLPPLNKFYPPNQQNGPSVPPTQPTQPLLYNPGLVSPPMTGPFMNNNSQQQPANFYNQQYNSSAIRPPPTSSDIAKQQQIQQQPPAQILNPASIIGPPPTGPLPSGPLQTGPLPTQNINRSFQPVPPPPSNSNPQLLTNQFNQMNLSSVPPPPLASQPPPTMQTPIPSQSYSTASAPATQPTQFQSQPTTSPSPYPKQNQQYNNAPNQQPLKSNYVSNRTQPNSVDLLREKKLINEYSESDEPPRPQFPHEFYNNVNCHYDTIRCTLTSIPESQNLLSKCRLPLGILIHPFKDLESLKVVQSSIIVRCRNCRSYINPFVHFIDNSKWRCNMCYSINDLPDEFLFDPVTRSYGDPSKRPEINSSTIEFIAPAEYTLRPPPPAMYLYLLDVSHNALSTGYLQNFCETLLENLDKIPGDSRTQIGFLTYNSSLHFYNLSESLSQPRMMMYPDIDDLVLPLPDNLMINLQENKESIQSFLQSLPHLFADSYETDSALGTALNAAYQMLKQTGGRITIMQTCLPNVGVGSLKHREESIDKDSVHLAPQNDFYKKLALDCAGVHIAVDLFMFNALYSDLSTLSCVSKYSGGEIKYYPGYHSENHPEQVLRFCVDFKRYLIRKIGFEAVMRIRCTRGLAIHTFHGNFFVRSTDLLALPNVNPDAGFGMQVTIEEALTDVPTVCFQAAVLYTSSKGERRIRIHTYCLPVSKNINEIMNGADQEAIIGLVAKMAVDRTTMSSLKEAKDAMVNVSIDYLQAYSQLIVSSSRQNALVSPHSLRLIPLYIISLMKNIAFKFGNIKMDDRVYAMNLCKSMPLKYLMLCIYPHLFAIHNLDDKKVIVDSSETEICIPPRLSLSSESIDRHGVYIMDAGEAIYMWIGRSVSDQFLQQVFDCKSFQELPDHSYDLPELDNILSERVRNFLVYLYDSRPFGSTFIYFREDSSKSQLFFQHMHEDKTESSLSYYEFLRHLNEQINN